MNVGRIDQIVRLVIAAALIVAGSLWLGSITTTIGSVAIVVGVVLGVTGSFSYCPVYKLLGISSLHRKRPS